MRTQDFAIGGNWPGRLAISPRPRGGDWLEDEVDAWQRSGIRMVVSLLADDEVVELGLEEENSQLQKRGMRFIHFPITDRGVPTSAPDFSALVRRLAAELSDGCSILIHCRQGIGRAGMLALGVMLVCGLSLETAIRNIEAVRGTSIPETAGQREWMEDFARSAYRLAA